MKKTNYDTKISDFEKKITNQNHDKYVTIPEFNTLAASVFTARLAQENLVTKTDFDTRLQNLNKKINSNKTKYLLVENASKKKVQKCDAGYFRGKNYFDNDGTQNYLVFQLVCKYFELNSGKVSSWESKEWFSGKIASVSVSALHQSNNLPKILYNNDRIKLKLSKISLKQDKATYKHGLIVNMYIVYELISSAINIGITLHNCLFSAVKLTKKTADIDKYKYSGHGTGFDSRGSLTHPGGGYGRNLVIFGAELSSSKHVNNKTGNILVLGRDFIQGVDGTTVYAEKMYSTNFTMDNKQFCSSLHYNCDNSYLFVSEKEIIKFKAKNS